jgi:hypothetical protein
MSSFLEQLLVVLGLLLLVASRLPGTVPPWLRRQGTYSSYFP